MTRCVVRVSRKGSLALEAALTVPLFLVVLLTLVSAIISIQAEMRLKTAADRTAAEISLLPPIIFSLIDEESLNLPFAALFESSGQESGSGGSNAFSGALTGLAGFIGPSELEAIVTDAAFDLASSAAFGRLVSSRIEYWLNRQGASRLISSPAVFLDWHLQDDQLYLEVYYDIKTWGGIIPRQCTAFVPVWRPDQAKKEKTSGQSVWQLDNFSRGQKLRDQFGSNLPANYPVIARFASGEVLAIKSIDLTKATYEDPGQLYRKIAGQITEVALFSGTAKPFGKDRVWIRPEDIKTRRLLLVVPSDSDFGRFNQTFFSLTALAREQGVTFEITTFGRSGPD